MSVPKHWFQSQSLSFLNLWTRVLSIFPPGATNGYTQALFMCVSFEETRFCNRVQIGKETLAAKSDAGTITEKEAKGPLQNVGVGFSQVQIKNWDKKSIISESALDPATLRFKDVTANHNISIQLGLRYLYAKDIGGQAAGHPDLSEFKKRWPVAARSLQKALRAADLKGVIAALNHANANTGKYVPYERYRSYWDFMFPPGELEVLFSAQLRGMA